ncbi:MAG TPA: ATP-binding protein [Candidatus Binataceae bacterium]|nr:ATP-binding protein [Candidatus Binataceae bacterium]
MKRTPSLRNRIRNGSLILLALVTILGAYALPSIYRLGGAIRETLYRNYVSIEAAQHMHAALMALQVAELHDHGREQLDSSRKEFLHWLEVEDSDWTEVGEPALAEDIGARAQRLFAEIAAEPPTARHDQEYKELHGRLDDLIEMNRAAMFRADSRWMRLGKRLTYELGLALAALLVAGATLSWALGWALSKPLIELADRLRGISQRKTHLRLGPQPLSELDVVAREFNRMAEQLEQYEKLNYERLLYEKSKTEAIIESLLDGVVLIDPEGIVTHINEVAATIMGVEPSEALGSPFDDLSSNHPHYMRIRDALRTLSKSGPDAHRVEVQLHVRGRDHSYLLKPMPLRHTEGGSLGILLILQDVTYLRDQDRARTNLVATLSHELRTPLTSLALSAELMRRDGGTMGPRHHELVGAIVEECARMKQLTDNLLNLARGELASIAVQRERIDLGRIANEVTDRFMIQAAEKKVSLGKRIDSIPPLTGDPVKLSWVLSNLIGNALRFTPAGGQIEVAANRAGDFVRLEVADSGPGIAPELRDSIFDRFAQYGNGAEKGSAGLGLAIAKDIVEAHGGRIFVDGGAQRGSRFVVELPAPMEL